MLYNLRPVAASTLTGLIAVAGVRAITLTWTIPADVRYQATEVWRSTTNNVSSAAKIATVTGNSYADMGVSPTSTQYYWVRAVNIYGRADGPWSNVASILSLQAQQADIADAAISAAKLAVAAISSVTGDLVANSVGTTQISDSAITSQKITANAITAGKIAANAVTAVNIQAGVITADKMSVDYVYTKDLSAGQITTGFMSADRINGGAITGSTINIASGNFQVPSTGYATMFNAGLSRSQAYNSSLPAATAFTITSSGSGSGLSVSSGSGDAITITGGNYGVRQTGGGANWFNQLNPNSDNGPSLGSGSFRWSEVFAGTATINTSDARLKQQVRPLSDAERAVAVRLKALIRMFKFNDAVAAKGDAARWHAGVIAQDVIDAFAAEGLDAERYGVLCHDSWDDIYRDVPPEIEVLPVLDESGQAIERIVTPARQKLVAAAGDRYGVRYEELLVFVMSTL